MSAIKEQMVKIIEEQPEDSSYDEMLKELIFEKIIKQGLEDSDNGKVISHKEMKNRIKSWRK